MHRRDFLRSAGGAAAVGAGAAGPAVAAESGGGNGTPDFDGYLSDVPNYDSVADMTGRDEVTVTVGAEPNNNFSFEPPAIHVDNGATVVWEWSGDGGGHNVVNEGGEFDSGDPVADAGTTLEHTFESDGIFKYFCEPHKGVGMKGAVVVGTDYPTTGGNGDGGGGPAELDPEHMGVPFQAHFVGMATILAILMALLFTFYTLKYGESAHTKGGSN